MFWLAMLSGRVSLVLAYCSQQLPAPAHRGAISGSHQVPQVPKQLQVACHPAQLLTHGDATLLHHLFIHGACCMTANQGYLNTVYLIRST